MALGADVFLPVAREMPEIDDRVIEDSLNRQPRLAFLDMQFSGPVTALATDRHFLDVHPLAGGADRLDPTRVAVQAARIDRPAEPGLVRIFLITRRHAPALSAWIPCRWGLDQKVADLHQVHPRIVAGAQREPCGVSSS